jgi:L-ascorbate metabolism protein UlaG (beta-lactamase superfamily)
MTATLYYLKDNVKIEPLIWKWYAWPQLIAPATAAMNIVERHIKIMESFISYPEIHKESANDPKLIGGSFMDIETNQISNIENLLKETNFLCKDYIQFSSDVKICDTLLQSHPKGMSLEPLYGQIPDNLKGLVELVYDLNNQPAMRFIEPLLYKRYYNPNNQSILFSTINNDIRPFALSTPRIASNKDMEFNFSFADTRVDEIYSLRNKGEEKVKIINLLDIQANNITKFDDYFTENKPELSLDRNYLGEGVRVRYFGHACVLLQTKECSILIDPVISYKYDAPLKRYTYNDLPDKIDYVIYTHGHDDHVLLESILQIRHKVKKIILPTNNIGFLADPSLKLMFMNIGFPFESLISINECDTLSVPNGQITAIPFFGEHCDLNIRSKLGYIIRLKNKSFLFLADSNNLEPKLYEYIFDIYGNIDVMFIGMECVGAPLTWLYGPLLTTPVSKEQNKSRRLSGSDHKKAIEILQHAKCQEAYIYAMGQEPWLSYFMAINYNENSPQIIEARKFISECKNSNIQSELLYANREWIY